MPIGSFVDHTKNSSYDDLSIQRTSEPIAASLDASSARKPRASFGFDPNHGDTGCDLDLGARCIWQCGRDGNVSDDATNLVVASVAELQLDAVAWLVFDIAFSALSYPFRYSDDDWIDLGALAVPQFADAEGILRNWAQMFVRGTRTDTLSLLKDLSFGVSEAVRYQTREDVRYSNAYGDAKSWLGLMPGFRRAVHRSSAHARVRGKDRLRLSSQSEPTARGIERCRIDACVGGGLRTGSRLDHFRSDEPQRRRLQPNPRRVARDIRQTIPVSGSHW